MAVDHIVITVRIKWWVRPLMACASVAQKMGLPVRRILTDDRIEKLAYRAVSLRQGER